MAQRSNQRNEKESKENIATSTAAIISQFLFLAEMSFFLYQFSSLISNDRLAQQRNKSKRKKNAFCLIPKFSLFQNNWSDKMKKETTGKHKNERNTNQPTQKKIIWRRRNKSISATFFVFIWMNETTQRNPTRKIILKKNMKKIQSRPV